MNKKSRSNSRRKKLYSTILNDSARKVKYLPKFKESYNQMVDRIEKERKVNKIERSEELLNESKLPTRMKIAEIRVQRKSEQFRQK